MSRTSFISIVWIAAMAWAGLAGAGSGQVVDRLPWHGEGVWLDGDTHAHGVLVAQTGDRMAQLAAWREVDFIAVTDHAQYVFDYDVKSAIARLRKLQPEVMIIAGVEWNLPAGDHATVLIEQREDEWDWLETFTNTFDRKANPEIRQLKKGAEETWGTVEQIAEGLRWVENQRVEGPRMAVMLNHLSRHDRLDAEQIEFLFESGLAGIEASPGHQKTPLKQPTIDRHDPFVANVGAGYDRMLAAGHRVALVVGSDFHNAETAYNPGLFSQTLVYAPERSVAGVVEGITRGATATIHGGVVKGLETRTFVAGAEAEHALISETLRVPVGSRVVYSVLLEIPEKNVLGQDNRIDRIEIISDQGGQPRMVETFTELATGKIRVDHHVPAEATASPRTFYLRVRGRHAVGGKGNDVSNADLLFHASATRVEVVPAATPD